MTKIIIDDEFCAWEFPIKDVDHLSIYDIAIIICNTFNCKLNYNELVQVQINKKIISHDYDNDSRIKIAGSHDKKNIKQDN